MNNEFENNELNNDINQPVMDQANDMPLQNNIEEQPVQPEVTELVYEQPVVEPVQPEVTPVYEQPVVEPVQPEVTEPVYEQPTVEPVQPEVTPVYEQPIVEPIQQPVYEAPQGGIVEPKKKGKAGLIAIIIALVVALAVGGYFLFGKDLLGGNKKETAESLSKKYVNNLINKKYEDNFKLIRLEKDSYVSVDDYMKYAQTKDDYTKIIGIKDYEVKETLLTTSEATYEFKFNIDNKNKVIEINLVKEDNKWKVKDGNFIQNWSFELPVETKVFIGGKEVKKEFITTNSTIVKEHVICTIPELPNGEIEITLEHKLGKSTITVKPNTKETPFLSPEITDTELLDQAYTYIKETWNDMYKDYVNKVPFEEVKTKYFDESVTEEDAKLVYTESFDKIIKSSTSGYNYHDFSLTEVVPSKKKQSVIYGDDILLINFGYRLQWYFILKSPDDMKKLSSIALKKDGDSFKIYKVTDMNLFTYTNSFTNEY